MKGCLGCLGALVALAVLAWPIEQLQRVFGWSDAETGYLILALVTLLAVGASGQREGTAVRHREAREARGALLRARYGTRQAQGLPARRHEHPGDRPMGRRTERRDQASGDAPAGQRVPRARDPLPAQLRFSVLRRDGFRCRYCGRPGSAPGVVLHVDHVVPVAAGGATSEDNLRTACEECNLGKAARVVVTAGS